MNTIQEAPNLSENETLVLVEIIRKLSEYGNPVHLSSIELPSMSSEKILIVVLHLLQKDLILECDPHYYRLSGEGNKWAMGNEDKIIIIKNDVPF